MWSFICRRRLIRAFWEIVTWLRTANDGQCDAPGTSYLITHSYNLTLHDQSQELFIISHFIIDFLHNQDLQKSHRNISNKTVRQRYHEGKEGGGCLRSMSTRIWTAHHHHRHLHQGQLRTPALQRQCSTSSPVCFIFTLWILWTLRPFTRSFFILMWKLSWC